MSVELIREWGSVVMAILEELSIQFLLRFRKLIKKTRADLSIGDAGS